MSTESTLYKVCDCEDSDDGVKLCKTSRRRVKQVDLAVRYVDTLVLFGDKENFYLPGLNYLRDAGELEVHIESMLAGAVGRPEVELLYSYLRLWELVLSPLKSEGLLDAERLLDDDDDSDGDLPDFFLEALDWLQFWLNSDPEKVEVAPEPDKVMQTLAKAHIS